MNIEIKISGCGNRLEVTEALKQLKRGHNPSTKILLERCELPQCIVAPLTIVSQGCGGYAPDGQSQL